MSRLAKLSYDGRIEEFSLDEVEDWSDVALRIRELLKPGVTVALSGPLGAGKTTLAQTLAVELGIKDRVQSPTFALLRTYRLPKPVNGVKRLVHVDAYRIEDEADLLPLELDTELSDGVSALVIEWPENAEKWLKKQPAVIFVSISL